MADEIDRAQEREQMDRDSAIAAARSAPVLPAVGTCHWCGDSVPTGHVFCDADCLWDWERDRAAQRRAYGGRR